MSDQDKRFQRRWEFRRAEDDLDSSSDDHHSIPSSVIEPKVMKQKLVTRLFSEENAQEIMQSPTPIPRGDKDNYSSLKERNRKPNKRGKVRERKAGSRRTKRTSSSYEPSDAASVDLRGYMESLVEGIKIAREDLLVWMTNEMKAPSKDDITTSNPGGTRKGPRQNAKDRKTPRTNQNNSRRKKSGTITQNREDESSEKKSPRTNKEVVVPPKMVEKVVTDAIPVEKTVKQKGKTSRPFTKKQKIGGTKADEQADKAVAANNCVTLPTVLPQIQAENSERNQSEDGNERGVGKRNELNSGVNLNSYQLNFDPRVKQKDAVFTQNGMRDVTDYEHKAWPTMGNGNGNGFLFPLASQGSNGGIGMQNVSSQFGLQYLTQGNSRIAGMYREPPGFSNGNHAFMENYGALNQQLKFNVQQSGVMALQCPDIRRAAFNQGNMTSK